MTIFRDRSDAGQRLGLRLQQLGIAGEPIVLALPRGGVPVACQVAAALGAPVDVLVVRKLGAPGNPELAVGAIALGNVTVYNERLLAELELDEPALAPIREREGIELGRRERAYRGDRPPPVLEGKTVIIVDDGVATGATMHAAVLAARQLRPREIVVAVPTSAADSILRLENVADRVVALSMPEPYESVDASYAQFPQLRDEDVLACLAQAEQRSKAGA
jgi:putative phosphoribosyl transferase